MRIISPERLLQLKTKYTPGTRVELLRMNDPYTRLSPGETGTVTGVDDIGTIHVSWDCGSSLGVSLWQDLCEIVKDWYEEERQ